MKPRHFVLTTALCCALAGLAACDDSSETAEKPAETSSTEAPAQEQPTAEAPAQEQEQAAAGTEPTEPAAGEQPSAETETTAMSEPVKEEEEMLSASARVGQGEFDATGQIPCAMEAGAAMTQCDFGVAREAGGTAAVAVTRPHGGKRVLFFENGSFASADISGADGDIEASAQQQGDQHIIQVGDERYEIPDAVISGG